MPYQQERRHTLNGNPLNRNETYKPSGSVLSFTQNYTHKCVRQDAVERLRKTPNIRTRTNDQ